MKNTNNFYVELKEKLKPKGNDSITTPKVQGYEITDIEDKESLTYGLKNKKTTEKNGWDEAHFILKELNKNSEQATYVEPELKHEIYVNQSKNFGPKGKSSAKQVEFLENWVKPSEVEDLFIWHLGDEFSQLKSACKRVLANPIEKRVRIAHFDTGILKGHPAMPENINMDLAKSFIDGDETVGVEDTYNGKGLKKWSENQGHGMGTISILAGNKLSSNQTDGEYEGYFGAIPYPQIAEIIPIRISETVALLGTKNFAKAIDYAIEIGCEVITMSMAGSPSRKWAKAVNKAYEKGIIIVTAAGNSWVKGAKLVMRALPKHVLFPARWDRVIAATGVCFNQKPYNAKVQKRIKSKEAGGEFMQGNHGPSSAMKSALAAYTPNLPWAIPEENDNFFVRTGGGTSSATPQIAAAAALWLVYNKKHFDQKIFIDEPWRKVEAVKKALFDSAGGDPEYMEYFGQGTLKANKSLDIRPDPSTLKKSKKARIVLAGLAELLFLLLRAKGEQKEEDIDLKKPHHAMYVTEALQLLHIEPALHKYLAVNWEAPEALNMLTLSEKADIIITMRNSDKASEALKDYLKTLNIPDNKNADSSDLRTNVARYITQLFEKQNSNADITWISQWLIQEGDEALVANLKSNPNDSGIQGSLKYVLKDLLKKQPFRQEMEKRFEEKT